MEHISVYMLNSSYKYVVYELFSKWFLATPNQMDLYIRWALFPLLIYYPSYMVVERKLASGKEIAMKILSSWSTEDWMSLSFVSYLHETVGNCIFSLLFHLLTYLLREKYDHIDATQETLDWRKRLNVMEGIGRASFICTKIHDLLIENNLLRLKTKQHAGRCYLGSINIGLLIVWYCCSGYMASEYAMGGRFSGKPEIFSVGVLVLEMASGRRNTSFYYDEMALSLLQICKTILLLLTI